MARPRLLRRLPFALAALALASATTTACGSDSSSTATQGGGGDRPLVVATTTQLADFARVVGGDDVEVIGLLTANTDAHDFEPAPADLDALARADVIVANGLAFEPWLDAAVEASGTDARVIDTSEGAELLEGAHDHEDEDHDDHEEGDDHADEDHADEEGDDHDHEGEWNPHLWFDPANAEVMVGHVAEAIAEIAPDAASDVQTRTDEYVAELQELDGWIEAELAELSSRDLVTDHDAFPYFIERYDLTFVGSIIPSFDSSAEISAGDLNELADEIAERDVPAIFTEQSLPADAAEALARQTDVQVVSGDEGLYGDALGPEGSPGETYLGMMRHNATVIATYLA